jgi:hypothetical protein
LRARQQFEKTRRNRLRRIFLVGANCQHRAQPVAKFQHARVVKALHGVAGFASTRRLVAKRGPFSENMKPSGTSRAHLRAFRLCEP